MFRRLSVLASRQIVSTRRFSVAAQSESIFSKAIDWFAEKYISRMRYQRYGLFLEDLYNEADPVVAQALLRLPAEVKEARQIRLSRAIDMSIHHSYLPEAQWTKESEDIPYLRPYMQEVEAEMKERTEWK